MSTFLGIFDWEDETTDILNNVHNCTYTDATDHITPFGYSTQDNNAVSGQKLK